MITLKNISGQVLQLHTKEFAIDEEFSTSDNWYIDPVINAITEEEVLVIGGNNIEEQIDILKGDSLSIKRTPPFGDKTGYNFSGNGIHSTISANTTQDIIFEIPSGVYDFTGVKLFHDNVLGDKADFLVVDTAEGTYSGYPNATLNQFAFNWNINRGTCGELMPYTARLHTGMKLVFRYSNNQDAEQTVYLNVYLHKVVV